MSIEKEPKVEKINEIIFLNKIAEELWTYHPDNKDQVDVRKEYTRINTQITKLQEEIKELS
jgi:hypothetical protein